MLKPIVSIGGSIAVVFAAREFSILIALPWIAFLCWWLNRDIFNKHLKPSKITLQPLMDSVFGEPKKADDKTEEKEQDDEKSHDS